MVFVLPVEARKKSPKYGQGLVVCKELADSGFIRNNVVFVQPEFVRMPWYANHPVEPEVRQLDFMVQLIQHFQKKYVAHPKVRVHLLGFSKSGWGSMFILCQQPDLVDGIMVWDSPLATSFNSNWGMDQVFGKQDYFMTHFYLPALAEQRPESFRSKSIIVGGYDQFLRSSKEFLLVFARHEITYTHLYPLNFDHRWEADWVLPMLQAAGLARHGELLVK